MAKDPDRNGEGITEPLLEIQVILGSFLILKHILHALSIIYIQSANLLD